MPSWKSIMEYAGITPEQILVQGDPNVNLRGYQVLIPGMHAKTPDYLYLIDFYNYEHVDLCPGCSIAVFMESSAPTQLREGPSSLNTLKVRGKAQIRSFLTKVNELFQIDSNVVEALNRMQRVINRDEGVQKLVDIIAELLGLTVDVLDNSFTFVASSRPYLDVSPQREQYAKPGIKPPPEEVDFFRKTGILNQLTHAEAPLVVHSRYYTTWTMPITFNWMKIGFMSIFDLPDYAEPRMNRAFLPYLPSMTILLGIEMGKREFYMLNKATFFTQIMDSILKGGAHSVSEMRERMKAFNYDLRECMYLLSVEPDSLAPRSTADTVLQEYLSRIFSNSIYVSQEFHWIFLISRTREHQVDYEELNDWNEYLKANGLCAGLTGPFYDFSDMTTRREETELAIDSGKRYPGQHITWFADHQVDALVEQMRRRGAISQYCYRPVLKLQLYDDEHGSELLHTLKEYLAHPKDIAKLCNAMHIHRNTLYSRLEKIRDIMECEISNAEEIMKIQLTFHLLGI